LQLKFGFPVAGYRETLCRELETLIARIAGVKEVRIQVEVDIIAHAVQKTLSHLSNVKNIIAVASGKGGVGKSTTAANLALALHAEGAKAGLLDADIYGPSQTVMLGMRGKPDSVDGKSLEPKTPHGIQAMSIGLLIDEETPMVWRGPMVTQALQQLLADTRWQDLDYLIVDLPPGTGDIQLTLSQKIPVSGAVIVTTPQDIALLDARKGLKMFEKVDVPVLGIIENMSMHICSQCGHVEPIFGEGGGARMAADYGVELLGALPLDIRIREQADGGVPSVVAEPEGEIARIYREIARKMTARLSLRGKDYSSVFPKIVIKND
jgi:ATP-binding protein involved in chromosome partitioning